MHLPQFDHAEMAWDDWRAFHVVHEWYFVQFDTGEFVIVNSCWSPRERRVYEDFHLQVTSTNDKDCPPLFVPGKENNKPIPKSHLNHKGMQVLLLDHDSQRAVSLEGWMTSDTDASRTIPERFVSPYRRGRNVCAYYAGPGAFPLGAVPITRHYPHPLTAVQRVHITELKNACEVWLQMQPDPVKLGLEHHKMVRDVQTRVDYFVDMPFSVLTTHQRLAIASHGFDMTRQETNAYLTFKTRFEFNKRDQERSN